MRLRALAAATLATALLMTGCAPLGAIQESTPTATATPSQTADPAPAPAVLVVSLADVKLVNDDDSVAATVAYSNGEELVALLTESFGVEPTAEVAGGTAYPVTNYRWGDAVVVGIPGPYGDGTFGAAWLRIAVAEHLGLTIRTASGIAIGADRAAVMALAPFDPSYDADGDGASDFLGLEPLMNPEVESLSFPGQPGTDFVEVRFAADTVTVIRSPSSDYHDV
jgi:hypothetical protein